MLAVALLGAMPSAIANDRTQKYRSGGCEVERKYGDTGKYESKVECKPGRAGTRLSAVEGKEQNGEYKEEVKCD